MRKAGIALSAFALAVTLGACGDNSGNSGNSANGGADTGGNAAAVNLAALTKSIGDQTVEKNSTHMEITATAAGQEITGQGDVKFGSEDAAVSMDMTTGMGSISIVFLDKTLYMKLPQEVAPGKPWVRIDPNSNSEIAKALGGMSDQLSKNADPRASLKTFEKSGEITDTREEDLNGTPTTHYTITVDVEKMAANQTDPTVKQGMEQAIAGGMKDFPVDVWVDEENLPLRFTMDTPTPDGQGGMTSVKMQIDYSEWGEPVDITAPPADQVGELPA
jgi:hypothetical protein